MHLFPLHLRNICKFNQCHPNTAVGKARFFGPWVLTCLVAKCIFPIFPWADAGHLISSKILCITHHMQMLYGKENNIKVFYFNLQLSKIAPSFKSHLHHLPRLKNQFCLSHCSTCIVSKSHFQLISQCTTTKENKIIKKDLHWET